MKCITLYELQIEQLKQKFARSHSFGLFDAWRTVDVHNNEKIYAQNLQVFLR